MQYKVIVHENIIKKDLYHNDQVVMTYTIKYPMFISDHFQEFLEKLNFFYKTKALMFENTRIIELFHMAVDEYEYSVANDFPIRQYEAFVDYYITYNQNCVISLYYDQYEYTGGAHGNTIRRSDTWNIQEGNEVRLSDLFSHVDDYENKIIGIINNQIQDEINNQNNYFFQDYQNLVVENFRKDNFYLVDKGVVIYFQHYDIAPYASGIPTFTILFTSGVVQQPECVNEFKSC